VADPSKVAWAGSAGVGVKAVAYFEAQHVKATSLKLAHVQSDAALNMGVALTLRVRAASLSLSLS